MTETLLETDRLILRRRVIGDLEANMAIDMDPAVHSFIWGDSRPDWQAHKETHKEKLIRQISSDWPPTGGVWAVERKSEPGFIGWCGLTPLENSGMIQIAYRYAKTAWGQGIATEAARTVLAHGFGALGLGRIVAVTHPDNVSSQHVLKKIGLKHIGMSFHYGQNMPFFQINAADYQSKKRPRWAGVP
ncbi:MAG: GNAT family N-acetyltransferase [Rhodospirillales bacterium]|nr:GNAT family N-acetyltransferase [Rhodospirillales bacterium]